MKIHTTNYKNTFIEIAEDCPVSSGQIPPTKVTSLLRIFSMKWLLKILTNSPQMM